MNKACLLAKPSPMFGERPYFKGTGHRVIEQAAYIFLCFGAHTKTHIWKPQIHMAFSQVTITSTDTKVRCLSSVIGPMAICKILTLFSWRLNGKIISTMLLSNMT